MKPHLPFTAPKKYWDMHDPAKFELAKDYGTPNGAPRFAGKRGGEITNYSPVPDNGRVNDELARKLIHGYYAATTYADAQVGRVLDELDRLKLAENTIIVLWGDHGWHFGDHGIWTKHTNYEHANRIPLVIIAPGMKPGSTRQLAENSAADGGVVVSQMRAGTGNFGFDAATGKYVDLVEAGIIDPTKVVRVALENAVSAAGILLLADATLTEVREPGGKAAREPGLEDV